MDLISRQDAIDAISTWDKFGIDNRGRIVRWYEGLEPYVHLRDVVIAIEHLPSAQKKGKWIRKDDETCYWYECSECGCSPPKDTYKQEWLSDFCPNCGADMRKGDEA